jgi:heat shock 70kDa protein 4
VGQQIVKEATKALDWLTEKVALQEQAKKTDDPVLVSADILKKEDTLRRFAEPILSKPPPAPKVTHEHCR